jgi:hypothetical protein
MSACAFAMRDRGVLLTLGHAGVAGSFCLRNGAGMQIGPRSLILEQLEQLAEPDGAKFPLVRQRAGAARKATPQGEEHRAQIKIRNLRASGSYACL